MKEHPILFTGEMVRAVLDNRKTQTRRTAGLVYVNNDPGAWVLVMQGALLGRYAATFEHRETGERHTAFCPYGVAGDQLWVRETFDDMHGMTLYRANPEDEAIFPPCTTGKCRWKPSIFMPRALSRIQLDLVAVRCEQVRNVSHTDALAEGVPDIDQGGNLISGSYAVTNFANLWEKINGGKRGMGWARNPWAWALTFKKVQP